MLSLRSPCEPATHGRSTGTGAGYVRYEDPAPLSSHATMRPGYMRGQIESFQWIKWINSMDKFDTSTNINYVSCNSCERLETIAVCMSCMNQNLYLLHLSNLSIRNIQYFLLTYPGSVTETSAPERRCGHRGPSVRSPRAARATGSRDASPLPPAGSLGSCRSGAGGR